MSEPDFFEQSLHAADFFMRRAREKLALRREALATEDPVGAAAEYLYAREHARLARRNLQLAAHELAARMARAAVAGDPKGGAS
jgi:hypothetical protein